MLRVTNTKSHKNQLPPIPAPASHPVSGRQSESLPGSCNPSIEHSNPSNYQATTASAGAPNLQQSALQSPELGAGWRIPFHNFDIYQRVRGMSEDNQNKDLHWIKHLKVTNRVSGNPFPDDRPICEFVADVVNKMLPTIPEHLAQRNY